MLFRKLLLLALVYISFSTKAETTVNVEPVNTLSSNSLLSSKADEPFTIIKVPTLYTLDGNKAFGEQQITFKLHSDAPSSVVVNGITVTKGQTVQFDKAVNSAGGLDIPIYPGEVGSSGTSNYTITLSVKGATCPAGYILSGGMCYRTTTQPAIKVCPSGYLYSMNSGDCSKTYTVEATKNCPTGTTYSNGVCMGSSSSPASSSCPAGYTRSGSNCYKDTQIDATKSCPTGTTYSNGLCLGSSSSVASSSCPAGYTRSGSSCYKDIQIDASKSCPSGYNVSGNQCRKVEQTDFIYMSCKPSYEEAGPTSYCPNGSSYDPNSTDCTLTNNSGSQCALTKYEGGKYVCGSGETLIPSVYPTCQKKNGQTVPASYSCPAGTVDLGSGVWRCMSNTSYAADKYCPSGYTDGGVSCEKVQTTSITYSCPSQYSLSGSKCNKRESASLVYSCPAGGTLNGTSCVSSTSTAVTYSCPSQYSLSGSKCNKRESASLVYSCPAGGKLYGTSCFSSTSTAVTYSCPENYILSVDLCSKTEEVPSTNTCPAGWSLEGEECTKTESVAP